MNGFEHELYSGNVISTRVRLARNIIDYPFYITNANISKELVKKVNYAVEKCDQFSIYFTSQSSDLKLEALKEKHLISQALIDNSSCGAVLINADQSISIMVCEEDVIREQCLLKGFQLSEAYNRLSLIDDELSKSLDFAFDEKLGYLTSCPSNVGTGLRASVMMFLPALSINGEMSRLIKEVNKLGLTIRGIYGEGSKTEGYTYQISNEVTLGLTEREIISRVEDTVLEICKLERKTFENLFTANDLKTMDRARKSFGILTNAVLLDYTEFLEHIAQVKLGAMLGMINIADLELIDDLIVSSRPAVLCVEHGKEMTKLDRDLCRAELVRNSLKKLID